MLLGQLVRFGSFAAATTSFFAGFLERENSGIVIAITLKTHSLRPHKRKQAQLLKDLIHEIKDIVPPSVAKSGRTYHTCNAITLFTVNDMSN